MPGRMVADRVGRRRSHIAHVVQPSLSIGSGFTIPERERSRPGLRLNHLGNTERMATKGTAREAGRSRDAPTPPERRWLLRLRPRATDAPALWRISRTRNDSHTRTQPTQRTQSTGPIAPEDGRVLGVQPSPAGSFSAPCAAHSTVTCHSPSRRGRRIRQALGIVKESRLRQVTRNASRSLVMCRS